MNQQTIFDMLYPSFKLDKPIRLIEMFSGYGSQALALKYLGVPFEHWKTCEWAVKSIQAYKDIHFTDDNFDYSWCYENKEDIADYLYEQGISSNYNEPMTKQQISRLNEKQLRTIYNNIRATHNLVNIQTICGEDLEIIDKDKYDYILTYSFPCQDLSLAGKGKGMSDTTTRSGMLWEVERILTECKELDSLPQVLLMENVPQVHGEGNTEDFNKWQLRLEELGYKNYWQDLIATDYGIPQTRNRCFMISILGDYNYKFPEPIPLKIKLKDLLEDQVDEKYFLSDKMINGMINTKFHQYQLKNRLQDVESSIDTLTTSTGERCPHVIEVPQTLPIKNANSKGYLEAEDGDGVDISSRMEYHRGTVQKGKTQTITTMGGENNGVVVNMRNQLCDNLIQNDLVEENDIIKINYTSDVINGEKDYKMGNNISPTLTTASNNELSVCVGTYQYAKSDNFMHGRDRLQLGKDVSDTLQTSQKEGIVNSDLRIRKLTPRECFRLMGVKDEDYEKCAKNQSNASLYHLAGDSIVVNVLMAIFKELL